MKILRNIISLLSLAAVASSPISGVLAPASAGGGSMLKYVGQSHDCGGQADALHWEPVKPTASTAGGSPPVSSEVAPPHHPLAGAVSGFNLMLDTGLPLYITNQSLLFYDRASI